MKALRRKKWNLSHILNLIIIQGVHAKNKDTGAVYAHNRIVFGAPGTGKVLS